MRCFNAGADPRFPRPLGATAAARRRLERHTRDIVELLIEYHADVNARHLEAGSTPLHYAIIKGPSRDRGTAVAHGADIKATYGSGATPLHLAADHGYREIVALLLAHGADVNARDHAGRDRSRRSRREGLAGTAALLVAEGAPVNARNPETGATPLNAGRQERACRGGPDAAGSRRGTRCSAIVPELRRSRTLPVHNMAKWSKLLLSKGAAASGDVMEDAVLKGQEDIVEILLAGGCDAKTRGKSGAPPLDSAALKGNVEIARLLVEHGADVDARNAYGATPLHDAALGGHRDVVALLLDHGADREARENESGSTPLYDAASMGRLEVVKLLSTRGADVNAANKSGATPLHAAVTNGFDQVAAAFRAHGAK